MSLAEVLTAARALPREEQLELVRLLQGEFGHSIADFPQFFRDWHASGEPLHANSPMEAPEAAAILSELSAIPKHLHQFIPTGQVMEYWKPRLTPEGWEKVCQALDEIECQR
jgi:hypothetical protein